MGQQGRTSQSDRPRQGETISRSGLPRVTFPIMRVGLLAVCFAGVAMSACGPSVPLGVPKPNVCVKTITGDVAVPKQQAADILIVVDNSGSMTDKQANLDANFLNQDATQCPLQDLANI